MKGQGLEEVTSFKYLEATLRKKDTIVDLLSRNRNQNHPGNGSDCQIKQDLAKQLNQLGKRVEVVQVCCHFHRSLRL